MKPYGIKRGDQDCCPGHNKYPGDRYRIWRTARIRRADQPRKTSARFKLKQEMNRILEEEAS